MNVLAHWIPMIAGTVILVVAAFLGAPQHAGFVTGERGSREGSQVGRSKRLDRGGGETEPPSTVREMFAPLL